MPTARLSASLSPSRFACIKAPQGDHAVVDLAPQNFTGAMPDLAAPPKPAAAQAVDVASLPEIKLRAGSYANFTRLVFDWPQRCSVHGVSRRRENDRALPGAGPARSVGDRPLPPPWVKNAAWRIDGNATVVEFETDSDSGYHDFKDGTKIVLDILAPKTDAAAYAPPGNGETASHRHQWRAIAGQHKPQAIADTAKQLADKNTNRRAPAKAGGKSRRQACRRRQDRGCQACRCQAATQRAAATVRRGNRTRRPAVPGHRQPSHQEWRDHQFQRRRRARQRGVRSRPDRLGGAGERAQFRCHRAQDALGRFRHGVEASSGPAFRVLRIGLKQPAQIAARRRRAPI